MSTLYHVLDFAPALEKEDMYLEQEALAERLVQSGQLRIDAHDKINFARFSKPYDGINLMFSLRELSDENLLPRTREILASVLRQRQNKKSLSQQINQEIIKLLAEIKKYQPISYDMEIKLARLLVQAAHPIVILMLLFEHVPIFVSYSYNIGDMLDIQGWQQSGSNSGMQSTNGYESAIFVSAGGNPLAQTEKDSIYGDGFPAIARMIIIAAQEIGHYSDIMRAPDGRQISRHSADFGGRRAKENVRVARLNDLQIVRMMRHNLKKQGLDTLTEYERYIKFFKKHHRNGWLVWWTKLKSFLYRSLFLNRSRQLYPVFMQHMLAEKFMASKINALLDDMEFNLEPKADVYARADKKAEEAIACIEALARVPQQVCKWGHIITRLTMPGLYAIYYQQVIPACIVAYEGMTGVKYVHSLLKYRKNPIQWLKRLVRKKEKTYRIWQF